PMQTKKNTKETGNVLLCVLGTILIVSLIGATVLHNSTTRLNASSNQVRAWKEALSAAETGGDIGFAELRKQLSDPANQWAGWTPSGTGYGYVSPETTFGNSNLRARTGVETCYFDVSGAFHLGSNPDPNANNWYRVRSKGTAPLPNLKRTGMDDALTNDGLQHFAAIGSTQMQDITARGKGNSLLRKIDFQYDHFVATYGPNGDGLNKALVTASYAPSISRRVEQIVMPVTPFFDAAIKSATTFYGLGSAAWIDSYDSRNGPYDPTLKTNPKTLAPPSAGTSVAPIYYVFTTITGALTVNPAVVNGNTVDTYVAIRVTGDISGGNAGVTVNPKVHLKIYFEGNISVKNNNLVNQNPSLANPYAGNLQFYGISPPAGTPQTVTLNPATPQTLAATFYAPSADVHENGNPDFIGTVVCKSFYSNGNISWHYDLVLNDDGQLLHFRIASYVEDTR